MSERSLSRTLQQQMGTSFGHWRRQLHVMLALQRLTQGESVQTVALDLGYESASASVTMFRKAVGKPPARYLAERNASGQPWAARSACERPAYAGLASRRIRSRRTP